MLTNYSPNFNDPRIKLRARRALGFVLGVLSETTPRQWSTRYLDTYFGQQQNQLSQWLRSQLVIVTDDKYYWGSDGYQCKSYIRNPIGCKFVQDLLEVNVLDTHTITPYCITSQQKEI